MGEAVWITAVIPVVEDCQHCWGDCPRRSTTSFRRTFHNFIEGAGNSHVRDGDHLDAVHVVLVGAFEEGIRAMPGPRGPP